ncbi:MAG: hypothetical protein HEQ39_06610 [Rhizobacter sp.]
MNITVLDAEGKPAPHVVILGRSTQGATATLTTTTFAPCPRAPWAAPHRLLNVKPVAASGAQLKLTQVGAITLGCHLHSSMHGRLYMADTPWFGKTDAHYKVSIDNVPDAATVLVCHMDQLSAQAPLKLQVAAGMNAGSATFNFTPRGRRRG